MTLKEAIEILSQHQKGTDPLYLPDLPIAEKLGIEALKYRQHLKDEGIIIPGYLLPGETKD